MGRTSVKAGANKNPEEKKIDRNRRMQRVGLTYVRPSKVEKDLRRAQTRDGRVGKGAPEHLAALLEFFFDELWTRLGEEAGKNHKIQLVHVAKALADPKSVFYGIFPTHVAGVFLPVECSEPKESSKKKNKKEKKEEEK